MFKFVLQKILSKKWMILSLVIGNILLIGIVAATPIYSQAVLQNSLDTQLSDYLVEENKYTGNFSAGTSLSKNSSSSMEDLASLEELMYSFSDEVGVDEMDVIARFQIKSIQADLENEDDDYEKINVSFLSNMQEHVNIITGEMYSDTLEEDGSIGVIISESMLMSTELLVGETYTLTNLTDANNVPYKITIKGVYENSSSSDIYWVITPSAYREDVFMSQSVFEELFIGETTTNSMSVMITTQLDFTDIKTTNVENIIEVTEEYADVLDDMNSSWYSMNFSDILTEHVDEKSHLNVTLLVLQVPIFILLAAFIYMVSRQILEMEQSEIAIFKSRGASKKQIISIYLIQSTMISSLSLIVGIPFGYILCQVLGSSNAFLEFVNRSSLPAVIGYKAVIYSLLAAVFSVVTMVLPVFKHANVGIVMAKRKKQQRFNLKLWEKLGVDLVLIAIALYGWYSVENQKEWFMQQVALGENLDPTIFIYSSVFIIGVSLLALRIFPWLMKLIFFIGKRRWSPSAYVSFRRVIGAKDNQGFIMVFLILTISIGIFNSITARTINSNEEDGIYYDIGADVVVQEVWADNSDSVAEDTTGMTELVYTEPDFAKYSQIEGVENYTKVYSSDQFMLKYDDGALDNVTVMGIETDEFGVTAWFDEDLLPYHWYEYLNAISQNSEAILMSSNAKTEGGFEVGDTVTYYNETTKEQIRGTIYAFIDYWPSYNSVTTSVAGDSTIKEINNYLIVANLSQLQSYMGVIPYEIWFDMEDSTQPIYDFATEYNLEFSTFDDASALVTEQKNDPIFQGTNGILTVGFITVLVLCTVGFLIYWILSMMSRQLQFGIFRAMGMSMKEILQMLGNEQLCVSGYAIIVGTVTGFIASKLYVPLVEITYTSADHALPLNVISNLSDNLKIFTIVALMIVVCMIVLWTMISKLKITQALKLGED
ncbi:MAG: ABC transporter permease [Clostridia bacterium]